MLQEDKGKLRFELLIMHEIELLHKICHGVAWGLVFFMSILHILSNILIPWGVSVFGIQWLLIYIILMFYDYYNVEVLQSNMSNGHNALIFMCGSCVLYSWTTAKYGW